jgi:hypothetical protein
LAINTELPDEVRKKLVIVHIEEILLWLASHLDNATDAVRRVKEREEQNGNARRRDNRVNLRGVRRMLGCASCPDDVAREKAITNQAR